MKPKKKIGLLLEAKGTDGGTFQYSLTILNAFQNLQKNNFDVIVVYTNIEWQEYLTSKKIISKKLIRGWYTKILEKVVQKLNLNYLIQRYIYMYIHPLVKELKNQNCDLWLFPASDRWSYLANISCLVTIYDLMHIYESKFPEVSDNGIFEWRDNHYKLICKYAKAIIVDSRIGKSQLFDSYSYPKDRIEILPFIAPDYIYKPINVNIYQLKFNYLNKYLFYPAQYWEHKNHRNLILAIKKLSINYPDILIVFVGAKYNAYHAIYSMITENNLSSNIKMLSYVTKEEMIFFYTKARALIMPTFFGPTNIPPLEANALGCPVAVSDIYGMREQIGNAALYFNPNSINDIADKIELLWTKDDLCERLKQNGLERNKIWNQTQFNEKVLESINKTLKQIYVS